MATNPLLSFLSGNFNIKRGQRDGMVKETNPVRNNVIPSFVKNGFNGDEVTVEEVMSIPAAQAAIDIISSSIAQLPIELHLDTNDDKNGFTNVEEDDRLFLVNNEANQALNGFLFKKKVVRDMLLFGSSKSYIKYTPNQKEIQGIYPLDMEKINTQVFTKDGFSFYGVDYLESESGEQVFYDELLLSVLRDSDDGITGKSIKDGNADVFKTALNQNQYERSLMENGAIPTSALETDKKLNDNDLVKLKQAFNTLYSGTKNIGKTMILENGLKYNRISLDPSTLKLSDNKKAVLSDIARVFNIPESMINSTANKYNSLEQNNMWFLQFTLMPLIVNFEQALNKSLLTQQERMKGYNFKFNINELSRPTVKDRNDAVMTKFNNGLISNFEAKKAVGEHIEEDENEYYKMSTGSVMLYPESNTIVNPNSAQFMKFDTQNGFENTILNSEGEHNNGEIGDKSITD